jgi:hypothetical protein
MAIYQFTVNTLNKAAGHSAANFFIYIARECQYREKGGLTFSQSGNMPPWAVDKPRKYWQSADKWERSNGRLGKIFQYSLPRESCAAFNEMMVDELAEQATGQLKLPYSLAVHVNDPNNPHCHMVVSERMNDEIERHPRQWFKRYNPDNPDRGGAKKTNILKPRSWLLMIREKWADICNKYLEKEGFSVRVSHKSYKDRGINKVSAIHYGKNVWALHKKGETTRFHEINKQIEIENYSSMALNYTRNRERER